MIYSVATEHLILKSSGEKKEICHSTDDEQEKKN